MSRDTGTVLYVTGGGGLSHNCVNISTIASIVASLFGINIIKHVSYNSNKKCSSAAFLSELGLSISSSIEDIEKNYEKDGIAFIDASPEMVLDNLCPLIADVERTCWLIGLNDSIKAMPYLFDLKTKGYKKVIIACSTNPNYDEVSVCSSTQIFELKNGEIYNYLISPNDYLIKQADDIELTGATPVYNTNLVMDIFSNKVKGAKLDAVALNSAIMLYVSGFVSDIKKGIMASYIAIEKGNALAKLESLRRK